MSWEARMAERAQARSFADSVAASVDDWAWAEFCRERGGSSGGVDRLYHVHSAAHGNATFSAVDGSIGGVFSVVITGDEPEPIDECPICHDVAAGLWRP